MRRSLIGGLLAIDRLQIGVLSATYKENCFDCITKLLTSLRLFLVQLHPVEIGRLLVADHSKLVATLSSIQRRVVAERLPIDRRRHAKISANCTTACRREFGDHIGKGEVVAVVVEVACQLQIKSVAKQLHPNRYIYPYGTKALLIHVAVLRFPSLSGIRWLVKHSVLRTFVGKRCFDKSTFTSKAKWDCEV